MRLEVGYPDRESEDSILSDRGAQEPVDLIGPVADGAVVRWMSDQLEDVHVSDALRSYLLEVANATRRHPGLSLGLSPRGVLAVLRVARGRAASLNRDFVTPDDIKTLAPAMLPHRLLPKARQPRAGLTVQRHRHGDHRLRPSAPQPWPERPVSAANNIGRNCPSGP